MTSEAIHEPPLNSKSTTSARRRLPPWWVIAPAAALAALAVGAQFAIADFDGAYANIATLTLAFFSLMSVLSWFVLVSDWPWFVRWASVAAIVLAVIAGFVRYKIDYVSGTLIPTFKRRGEASKDSLLEKPAALPSSTVDLKTTAPEDFSQFLGSDRNLAVAGPTLETDWRDQPPRELWRRPIGAGLSAFSAVNGFAVTQEQRGNEELVTCYDIESGNLQWLHATPGRHETILGRAGPRATPTIHEGRVYAQGATGVFVCLDGASGKPIWEHNLLTEFGVASAEADRRGVNWGRSGSPLVVDGLVIIPAGGPAGGHHVSLVAFDAVTGEQRWQGGVSQVSYSSPSLASWDETRQVLIVNESSVAGHDLESGNQLWEFPWPGSSTSNASASQAIGLPGLKVLVSKGYNGGSALWQLARSSKGNWSAKEIWADTVLKSKFTNVAIRDGFGYALSEGVLECVEIETGERQWKRGRYGHGQILLVGDVLLVLGESGDLSIVEATPKRRRELGRIQALNGQTWNNLCLYGDRLLVRNSEEAACYRLAVKR